MNLTEVIRAVIDRHICTRQASEDNKRLLTEAIVKAIPRREHGKWINHPDDLYPQKAQSNVLYVTKNNSGVLTPIFALIVGLI